MRASLLPLSGKYYGTEIELYDDSGRFLETITLWIMGDYEPSKRALENWDSPEEFKEWCSDSHFESVLGYETACMIVEAINGKEENADSKSDSEGGSGNVPEAGAPVEAA